MKFTGKVAEVSIDFDSRNPKVTLVINEKNAFFEAVDELKGYEKLSIEMKRYRERRSLDANAYCWVLLDKLSEKLNVPKEELYRISIREIGGNSEIVCVKNEAVDKLRQGWEHNGLGWCTDTMPSKIEGCTNVILYYGSSTYDSAQMSRLIDNICQDCRAQGIQVETPNQIAEMKARWGECLLKRESSMRKQSETMQ